MDTFSRLLFGAGASILCSPDESTVTTHSITSGVLSPVNPGFSIPAPISSVFESRDPATGEPGFLLELTDSSYFFHSYSDSSPSLAEMGFTSTSPRQSVFFGAMDRLVIEDSELVSILYRDSSRSVLGTVAEDSIFICSSVRKALLISREPPLALLVSSKKTVEFPIGFAPSMISAAFFDSDSIVFSTNDRWVHLYSKSNDISSIEVESNVVRIETADLDCYERTCLCLTDRFSLLAVHFSSQTIELIAEDVRDFCVTQSPFDTVVLLSHSGELRLAKFSDHGGSAGSIRSVIDALDSRVVAGLAAVSELRRRLTLRENLAKNCTVGLPAMTPLFGQRPAMIEEPEAEFSKPSLWIENVNELQFEVHCDIEFPPSCDVLLSSNSCSFVCSCINSLISSTAMSVSIGIEIERMSSYSAFRVFVRNGEILHFAGSVEFDVSCLTQGGGIKRISEEYFVSFPSPFAFSGVAFPGYEIVDNGVIMRMEEGSIEKFEQAIVRATVGFPDGSLFERKDKSHYQVQVAKELVRYINRFFAAMDSGDGTMNRSDLVEMKATVNDFLACILW
jgi:hypothetical protein